MGDSVENKDSLDWGGWEDWDENEYARQPSPAPGPGSVPVERPLDVSAPLEAAPTRSPTPRRARRQSGVATTDPIPHNGKPNNFPAFMARSAMFRVSSCSGEFDKPTVINAQQGYTVTLTGPKLSMRDKHVWETAIQIAKESAPNIAEAFQIELRDFARRMGSSNQGGRALASLWESLERLARCRVEFQIGESCKGIGSLLATAFRAEGKLYLRLNPDFARAALKGDKQFLFDQARRSKLPTSLAQWLHDFYSTHKVPLDLTLDYVIALCGYEGAPRNFPGKLRAAMEALTTAAPNLVSSFEIIQTGRCSDSWRLSVTFGEETPSFLPAERVTSESRTGRSRVAL